MGPQSTCVNLYLRFLASVIISLLGPWIGMRVMAVDQRIHFEESELWFESKLKIS